MRARSLDKHSRVNLDIIVKYMGKKGTVEPLCPAVPAEVLELVHPGPPAQSPAAGPAGSRRYSRAAGRAWPRCCRSHSPPAWARSGQAACPCALYGGNLHHTLVKPKADRGANNQIHNQECLHNLETKNLTTLCGFHYLRFLILKMRTNTRTKPKYRQLVVSKSTSLLNNGL